MPCQKIYRDNNNIMKQNIPDRVRAVIIQDDKIMAFRRDFDDGKTYWTFPGGHIEKFDKNEKEALKRECMEEVNLEVKVGNKIYEQDYKGAIIYFYMCTVIKGEAGYGNGPEYTHPEDYRGNFHPEWISIKDLNKYDLRPNELRDKIKNGI